MKNFIPLVNLKIKKSIFENGSRSRFFAPFVRLYLENAIYLTFSRLNGIELKKCIIPACMRKFTNMNECVSVVIRAFLTF